MRGSAPPLRRGAMQQVPALQHAWEAGACRRRHAAVARPAATTQSHYDELGVAPTATPQELKAAWRAQARQHHPDLVHSTAPEHVRRQQEERLRRLNEAFEVLSDARLRAAYDAQLQATRALEEAGTPGAHGQPLTDQERAELFAKMDAARQAIQAVGAIPPGDGRATVCAAVGHACYSTRVCMQALRAREHVREVQRRAKARRRPAPAAPGQAAGTSPGPAKADQAQEQTLPPAAAREQQAELRAGKQQQRQERRRARKEATQVNCGGGSA